MNSVLAAVPAAAGTKVFLLAGQSNMLGYGVVADLPEPYNASPPNVKLWDSGSNQWTALRGGFGATAAYFGPEVAFGHQIAKMFPHDNIYLVKSAVGGTNLAVDWKPDGSGSCYKSFQSTVSDALQNLSDARLSPTIAGTLWMQGESDTLNHGYAAAYADNLRDFIVKVRSDLVLQNMPFIVGRIESYSQYPFGTPTDNTAVRTAQATVPGHVGHASWISTDDLSVYPIGSADQAHFDTDGQIGLGLRFADQFAQTPEPSMQVLSGTGLLTWMGCRWWRRTYCRQGQKSHARNKSLTLPCR